MNFSSVPPLALPSNEVTSCPLALPSCLASPSRFTLPPLPLSLRRPLKRPLGRPLGHSIRRPLTTSHTMSRNLSHLDLCDDLSCDLSRPLTVSNDLSDDLSDDLSNGSKSKADGGGYLSKWTQKMRHKGVNNTVDIACGLWISPVDNPSKWGARRSNPIYKSPGQRAVDNLYTGYTQGGVDN